MMLGDHERAWQDVCQAYDSFPDYMLYFGQERDSLRGRSFSRKPNSNGRTGVSRRLSRLPRTSFTFH